MDQNEKNILKIVADMDEVPTGTAYNIRSNCGCSGRNSTENIKIENKADKPGIDIIVKPGTKNEVVMIPVVITESGVEDLVYNDFFIGEDTDITIIAGCGIHNCGDNKSQHDGIHTFHLKKNARVKYIEKHYGEADGRGENVLNPVTVINMDEDSYMEMDTVQIKGVDSTTRDTQATLKDNATLIVKEKLLTDGVQYAKTDFVINLDGENCSTHVVSRSVAKGESKQYFVSNVIGNNKCMGHTECDAIIMDNAIVHAKPEIVANHIDASLIHEAAIGKIAGEQIMKLMTLGLTEEEAQQQIVNGFLK
ncbi:MAG: SufD family Fe-S cluster assembly protein [Selenomonadales bacterium]|nr:SufD family Fe-S cluster assembly protein [Selenomonadales bacterium]